MPAISHYEPAIPNHKPGELEGILDTLKAGDAQAADRILRELKRTAGREAQRMAVYRGPDDPPFAQRTASPGEAFVTSPGYEAWVARFGDSVPRGPVQSDPTSVSFSLAGQGAMRSLVSASDSSAGDLVAPDFRGLLEPGRVRPLTLRDLVAVMPTASDSVDYAEEQSRVEGATAVNEAAALTGTTGTKPEGGLVFERKTSPVQTLALWIAVTSRIIADAVMLQRYVDDYLGQDIGRELEDQMLVGDGVEPNLLGILNSSIQTAGPPGGSESMLDALRKGKTKVAVVGRAVPSAVVMHPTDAETMDLLKIASEVNHFAGPGPYAAGQRSVWGLPVVETTAMTQGHALVGDFRRAVLFERQVLTVSLGTVGDDFIRNIVRVLGEVRAAFAVIRPSAFVDVDLAA